MSGIIAIFRKELRGYFTSPIAYVVATIFWFLAGTFFSQIVTAVVRYSQQVDSFGGAQPFDAATAASQNFLSLMSTLMLFILPILSMNLYSEERRRGTMELLATSPITNLAVALGKWLSVLVFVITLILPIFAYTIITLTASDPPINVTLMLTGYLGLIILAGAVLAFGLFISSLTDNTLIAALGSFGLTLMLWVIDAIAGEGTNIFASALRHLSLLQQYQTWVQGSVTLSSIVLFLSMIGFGLFLTVQSVEALRWQQN